MVCHPNDLRVTANKTVKTRVLMKSPQTTGTTMLDMETLLVTVVTFGKVTPGSGEETPAVDLGKAWVTVLSLGRCFVVIRMGALVRLVVGVMLRVGRPEESLVTTRRTG